MRIIFTICALLILFSANAAASPVSGELPPPVKSGGEPVLDALETRHSTMGGKFLPGEVSMQQLSTALWATAGRNRADTGWVVPTLRGKEPYIKIYVIADNGVFFYDGAAHSLEQISTDGSAKSRAPDQEFVKNAAYTLVFVNDGTGLEDVASFHLAPTFAYTLVGAMTQNLNIAAPAIGIGTRYIVAFDDKTIREALKLADHEVAVCLMPLTALQD